jgi:L-amino acid N-acyltransferase YncA
MQSVSLRAATVADLPVINAIYNHYVIHSTCTFQITPETEAARRSWFERHHEAGHPVLVATAAEEVVGWGSLSRFYTREAFRHTVENSVYVRHDWQRRGVGARLLDALLERGVALGHHAVVAAIESGQQGSLALHASRGFGESGRLREVGFKFGRWLDLVYMERILPGASQG